MYVDKDMRRAILQLAHRPPTASPKRTAFIDAMMLVHLGMFSLLRLGHALDERWHAEFRDVDTGHPIFIVAAPRSGTTLLHRLLALDPQFTTLKLFDTLVPSISLMRGVQRVIRHSASAAGFDALVRTIEARAFEGWEGIHTTSLSKDEEDEALWVYSMTTPSILMCAPYPERLRQVMYPDTLPEQKRLAMTRFFKECMQRHLYMHPGKTLLCKNVMMSGRYHIVTDALPGARFVHIARHPYQAIPSAISMFTTPWRFHSPDLPPDSEAYQRFGEMFIDYYRTIFDRCQESLSAGDGRFVDMTYAELVHDPARAVRRIYEHYELELTPEYERTLAEELRRHREYRSQHSYSLEQFGLTKKRIYEPLADIFEHYGFEP